MGTPHIGSPEADIAEVVMNVMSVAYKTNKRMLDHLKIDSSALDLQRSQYSEMNKKIKTLYCWEEYETEIPGGISKMVNISTLPVEILLSDSRSCLNARR